MTLAPAMRNQKPQTTRDVKRMNRSTLLQAIYFSDPVSRLELSQRCGMSPATVTNLIAALLDSGLVIEVGLEESQGGRPRQTVTVNPDYGHIIGIDLGETHISFELFDMKLNRIAQFTKSTSPEENRSSEIVDHVGVGVRELLAVAGVQHSQVVGAGIGVPGVVDPIEGISVTAPNWGWQHVPLRDMLRQNLDMRVWLNNGAQAMALAEMWFGAGQGVENLAVLLVGTGVGAGITIDGKLYRGASNSAGEWGHHCIEVEGRACRCGSRGCIEAYIGAPSIIQRLQTLAPDSPLLHDHDQIKTLTAINAAAQNDDPCAMQVLDDVVKYMAVGIANLINLYNPQQVTLGGWAGMIIGNTIINSLRQTTAQYTLSQPWSAAAIELSQLGRDAVNLGAACLVLERLFDGEIA